MSRQPSSAKPPVRFMADEIVWAKVRGHAAWPARIRHDFESNNGVYKPRPYRMRQAVAVIFAFSLPQETSEVAPNNVFKFVPNYGRFSKAKNRVSIYALTESQKLRQDIGRALRMLPDVDKEALRPLVGEI